MLPHSFTVRVGTPNFRGRGVGYGTSWSRAHIAAWTRSVTPIRWKIVVRWALTVLSLHARHTGHGEVHHDDAWTQLHGH